MFKFGSVRRPPARSVVGDRPLVAALDDGALGRLGETIDRENVGFSPEVPIVFGCLVRIISRVQALPVRVVGADGQPRPTPRWFGMPSSKWSWSDLVSQAVWSLIMEGDLYLWPLRDRAGRVVEVMVVRPDDVQAFQVADQRYLGRVTYAVRGVLIPDLVHVRYLSSPGEILGTGTRRPSKRAKKLTVLTEETLVRHFTQGTRLQTVFASKEPLTREALTEATRHVRAHYEGINNSWRPIVLGSGVTVHTLSQNADQGKYLDLSQWADARVAAQLFGIDPTLLGINLPGSQLTYSNAVDREANMWRDAIRPPVTKLEEAFTRLVAGGNRVELVETGLLTGGPRDRVAYAKELAEVNRAVGAWVVGANEIREAVGLLPQPDGWSPAPLRNVETGRRRDGLESESA